MNVEFPKKKCPFCHQEAFYTDAEIEGEFPDDRVEVRCENCGDYHLLSKSVKIEDGSLVIPRVQNIDLDHRAIARANKYAHAEGKLILWLDSFEEVNKWEEVIKEYSGHYAGLRPFEVRVVADFEKI